MGVTFCPQAKRFSAAILTDCKGKQRSMRVKRPPRQCAMLIKVTYYPLFASSVSSWSHTALKL